MALQLLLLPSSTGASMHRNRKVRIMRNRSLRSRALRDCARGSGLPTILLVLFATTGARAQDRLNPPPAVPTAASLHASFWADDWKLTHIWGEGIAEILSRQLPSGALVESSPESGLYPHIFPRAVWPVLLAKAGYLPEVRRYLDFMWMRQAKDGSFANFYRPEDGKGMGVREEDGGSYLVWATETYARYGGEVDYVRQNWNRIVESLEFVLEGRDSGTGLLRSTAGAIETTSFEGGLNLYHQLVSLMGLRSGARLAARVGDQRREKQWTERVNQLLEAVQTHLVAEDGRSFVYKRDDPVNQFWGCYFLFSFWDLLPPTDERLAKTLETVMAQRVLDVDGLLALRPFSITSPTGTGAWLGQWGHGMVIPHFLKAGDLSTADRWLRNFVELVDTNTFLVPEHINVREWDADGGRPDFPQYGLYPDPSAWVDPGNLYSEGTALLLFFTMADLDPADSEGNLYLRIPPSIHQFEADNVLGPRGPVSVRYARDGSSVRLAVSGSGQYDVHLVGVPYADGVTAGEGSVPVTLAADARGDATVRVQPGGKTLRSLDPARVELRLGK